MQDSFYRNFLEQRDKIVAFIGGGGKSTLMQRLSRDCLNLKKKVVILSLHPMFTPLEANVLLSDNLSSLDQQIKKEFNHSSLLYVGKKLNKGSIENFSVAEVKKFMVHIQADHIFIEADSAKGRSLSGYHHLSISLLSHVDRYINVLGADALSQTKNSHWISYIDDFWQSKNMITPVDIAKWLTGHHLFTELMKNKIPSTFFINKVENIYLENLAIPLAKNLKMFGTQKVLVGSVFNSNIYIIR